MRAHQSETHDQLTRSTIQVRISRTRAFSVSPSEDGRCARKNEERMLMTKNGERKFYFTYRPSKMRSVSREKRRALCETQMRFNGVVILTDGITRQLTGASLETYLSHAKGRHTFAYVQSTRVEQLATPTSRQRKNVAQILSLLKRIPAKPFAVGAHKLTYPFVYATPRTEIPKDKKSIECCCIVFRKERLQMEQFWLRVYPLTVQWCAMADFMNPCATKVLD